MEEGRAVPEAPEPESAQERWNRRYAAGEFSRLPSPRLVELSHLLPHATSRPPGRPLRALDLACGAGRNTLYLLSLGYEVDAWDVSDEGLRILREEVPAGNRDRLRTRQVDLEAGPVDIPPQAYDLVVVTLYLHRPLLPHIRRAVRPGGVVFYHSFYAAGPGLRHRPDHTLRPGELLDTFRDWEVLHYGEDAVRGLATLVARRPPAGTS